MLKLFWIFFLVSCNNEKQFQQKLAHTFHENPNILSDAIAEKPTEIVEALSSAVMKVQSNETFNRERLELKDTLDTISNVLHPRIANEDIIQGMPNASITLVEYADFECPYSSQSLYTVNAVLAKYGNSIKFVYKHLPLPSHKNALIAAKYYEAIRLQDPSKAWQFHDIIFYNQHQLSKGESYLKSTAKNLGIDLHLLSRDLKSEKILERIQTDLQEAQKFGIQQVPSFLVNGVLIKGARPPWYFDKVINDLKLLKKINI